MKNKYKQGLAILLATVMCLNGVPLRANAETQTESTQQTEVVIPRQTESTSEIVQEELPKVFAPKVQVSSNVDYQYTVRSDIATITKYTGTEAVLKIPEEIDGYIVGKIKNNAFDSCIGLTEVEIPASVTEIGNYAFVNCLKLEKITLNEGVITIGRGFLEKSAVTEVVIPKTVKNMSYALYGAQYLNKVTFAEGMVKIPNSALETNSSNVKSQVETVVLPSTVTEIGSYAFKGCEKLTGIQLPKRVRVIGYQAFESCTGLTEISFPESVTEIGSYAFCDCIGLTGVNLSVGLTKIGSYAFDGCIGLIEIEIPVSVTEISNSAFVNCTKLEKITLNEGLKTIGNNFLEKTTVTELVIPKTVKNMNYALYGAQYLKKVTFAEGMTKIPDSALGTNSSNVKSQVEMVVLPSTVTEIGSYAFKGCERLTSIELPEKVRIIGVQAFDSCTGLTKIEMPESVTEIGSYAFDGCTGLTEIKMPESVIEIGDYAFANCTKLEKIILNEGLESIGSYFLEKTVVTELFVPKTVKNMSYALSEVQTLKKVTFAEGMTKIPDSALGTNSSNVKSQVETVVLPSTVTEIGSYAFRGCERLTSIELPEKVRIIGFQAFDSCTGLTKIEMPESITEIGSYAFDGCTGLTEIKMPESVIEIGDYAFANCTKLEKIILNEGLESIGSYFLEKTAVTELFVPKTVKNMSYALSEVQTLKKVTFAEGMTKIPDSALGTNSSNVKSQVETVVLPSTVTEIGSYAFRGCERLTSIELPEKVRIIGFQAFDSCTGLTKIEMPESITEIGSYAFDGCTGLTEIKMPESVIEIGDYAFANCTKLEKIILNEGLESIGSYFLEKTAVTELFVPKTVKNMSYALSEVQTLKKVTFAEGMTKIPDSALRANSSNVKSQVETVVLPSTVTEIGSYAFRGCERLTSIKLPEKVRIIGFQAFDSCTGLTKIEMPESVTEIGSYAFDGCTGLKEIKMPESVIEIGDYAFANCTKLEKIILNEGLESIGSYFLDKTAVTELMIPSTVKNMSYSLYGARNLKKVIFEEGITKIPDNALATNSSSVKSQVEEVIIPDSVNEIGNYAFRNCEKIQHLYLPKNLTQIGYDAFSGFKGRIMLEKEDSNTAIYLIDHEILYEARVAGITDKQNRHLDRNNTAYYMTLSTATTSGYVNMKLTYSFKESAQEQINTSNMRIKLKLSAETILMPGSLKVNGEAFGAEPDNNGYMYIPVDQISGDVTFSLKITADSYPLSYAQLEYIYAGKKKIETIGIANMANGILTLDVPDKTDSDKILVSGIAEPNQTIQLYLDGEQVASVSSSRTGTYSAEVSLLNPQENDIFKIEAKTTYGNKEVAATAYTEYKQKVIKVTQCTMYYRGKSYDLLEMQTTRPVISWSSGSDFTFKISFSDNEDVGDVYIVSTKNNGEEKKLRAVWNEAQEVFVASGFRGYVPGVISVRYGEGIPEIMKNAGVELVSSYDEENECGYESKISLQDSTEYYYLQEQSEQILTLPEGMERVDCDGKTYFLTQEMKYITKGDKTYGCQEMYIPQDDGTYVRVREGIGLKNVGSAKMLSTVKSSDDPMDTLNEVKKMINFLGDTSREKKDEEVYAAIDKILEDAEKVYANDPDHYREYYEVQQMRIKLANTKLISDSRESIKMSKKVIKYGSEYDDLPDWMPADEISEKMQESVDEMDKVAKEIENKALRDILKKMCDNGLFEDSFMEKLIDKLEKDASEDLNFRGKYAIDPSGYVYEAIPDNRVEGVKTTIYYKETEDSTAVLWDASEYDQQNPLYTDEDGAYAWDVPEGLWQVKYEKEGYETTYSDWLPVPPPQLDVNVGIISKAKPEIESFTLYSDRAEIVFSKYMIPESVSALKLVNESGKAIPYTLKYDTSNVDAKGINYAREYTLQFEDGIVLKPDTIGKIVTNENLKSYADVSMDSKEVTVTVNKNLELIAPDEVTVKMGETLDVPVSILNASEKVGLSAVSVFEEIASINEITSENIRIYGDMLGTTDVVLSIPGTNIQKNIRVTVATKSEEIKVKPSVVLPQSVYVMLVGESMDIVPEVYPNPELQGTWTFNGDDGIVSLKGNTFTAETVGEIITRYTLADNEEVYVECKIIVQKEEAYTKGDVNEDSSVDSADLRFILRSVCGKTDLTERQTEIADVTGEGTVDSQDLRKVLRFICGKIDEL